MAARRTNNNGVIRSWTQGEPARNSRQTLTTDGVRLFSYALCIGVRSETGTAIVGDYTAPAGGYHSQTTSCHVGRAKAQADDVWHPLLFKNTLS